MQAKYDETAQKNKCYVVSACGWDSIPSDLGVHFLQKQTDNGVDAVETFCEMNPGPEVHCLLSSQNVTYCPGLQNQLGHVPDTAVGSRALG